MERGSACWALPPHDSGAAMKLLSDFDGVWTEPSEEAVSQGEVLDGALVEWAGPELAPRAAVWIAEARAAVAREPWRWGWAPGGRLSAFGDEDPFAAHSGLLHYLHGHAPEDPIAAALQDAVRRHGFETLDAFGGHTHARGVERVVERRGPRILPASVEAGHRLLDRGVEVVVVSNSGTDKLVRWFGSADLPLTVRPVDVPINADADTLRVRLTYIIAVIVAGGFGLLLALLLEYVDDTLDGPSAAASATGLELLGVVPGDAR